MIIKPKQYGVIREDNIKRYILCAEDSDTVEYPTIDDCNIGSTITVIDTVQHQVLSSLLFDGRDWNIIPQSGSNDKAFSEFLLALNGEEFA